MKHLVIPWLVFLFLAGQLFAQSKHKTPIQSTNQILESDIAVKSIQTHVITDTLDRNKLRESLFQEIGYGIERKSHITGAVSSVNIKSVELTTYRNLAEYLMGRVAGVSVTTDPGSPGGYSIIIRGVNSLNFQSPPLFIINGVPVPQANALNAINPIDIASVDIIKDGTAAIYGTRGANGVILITTK